MSDGAGVGATDYRAWCRLLGRPCDEALSPLARAAALPRWAVPPLVATEAARSRLRAWAEAGSPAPSADDVVRGARTLGCPEIRSVVLRALLEDVPPPARWWLLGNVVFAGVGWSAGGMAIQVTMPALPILHLVLVDGSSRDERTVRDLVLHEASHQLLLPDPPTIPAESLANEISAMLLRASRRPDLARQIAEADKRDEDQADALARAWGAGIHGSAERAATYTARHTADLVSVYGARA